MSKVPKWSIAILLILVVLVLASLFTNDSNPPPPEQTTSSDKVEMQGELVSGFPEIPVYPESELISSYKKSDNGMVGYEGAWRSDDDVPSITQWYLDSLDDSGWNITDRPDEPLTDGEQFLVAEKNDITLNLIVENESGETEIHAEFPVR